MEVLNAEDQLEIVRVERKRVMLAGSEEQQLCFQYRLYTYWLDKEEKTIRGIESEVQWMHKDHIIDKYAPGRQLDQVAIVRDTWGTNQTTLPEKHWHQVLVEEALSPFSIFQVFSCVLWFFEKYTIYAVIILVTSVVSSVVTVVGSIQQQRRLRRMNDGVQKVQVVRGGRDIDLPSD